MAMSAEPRNSFGGIKVRNQNEINITLFCEICKLLQLHAMQLLCCGTRLCRWCSKKGLLDGEPFTCPFCQTKQSKKQTLADCTVERELNLIQIQCYSCSWNGLYKDYLEHLQQYHTDIECPDCRERFFAINSLEEHRQESCEYRCTPCGLPGCVELAKVSEMHTHYLSDNHQKVLYQIISPYIPWKRLVCANSNHLITPSYIARNTDQELISIEESVRTVSPGLENLSNGSTQMRSEHEQMNTGCESTISALNNVRLLDNDGATIFSFHKHSGEFNSSFSIDSPIFKASVFGYSIILRVYSTIDSTNENQGYLSVYITLLRGDFDQILFYPFPYNISLYLCDQSGQGKDIVSTIKPELNSPSFARPTSEKNAEIGIMKFCPLSYLADAQSIYLKDGVFFIRVIIDFMNSGSIPS